MFSKNRCCKRLRLPRTIEYAIRYQDVLARTRERSCIRCPRRRRARVIVKIVCAREVEHGESFNSTRSASAALFSRRPVSGSARWLRLPPCPSRCVACEHTVHGSTLQMADAVCGRRRRFRPTLVVLCAAIRAEALALDVSKYARSGGDRQSRQTR